MNEEQDAKSLLEDYEKQIFDLRQLLEISKSLNSTLEYGNLIDAILYIIMGQMRVLKAGLFAKKGLDTPMFCLHRNYKGFELDHSVDYSLPEDHPLFKLVQKRYACYTMDEIRAEGIDFSHLEALLSMEPSLVVPLKAKGEINGLIVLADRIEGEDFSAYDREYVLNIASLASIAISNAFLFEMTTTDMMTKLKMKHFFYQQMMEKMDSAATFGTSLSVIMMDIDHFKKFNDTWGHSCGDLVLKHVARLIQGNIRGQDLAARYGGEEFCVLLPETSRDEAMAIAERIRRTIMNSAVDYEGRQLGVTISLGVAEYDTARDMSAKALVNRADKALYVAKQDGRNRVSPSD